MKEEIPNPASVRDTGDVDANAGNSSHYVHEARPLPTVPTVEEKTEQHAPWMARQHSADAQSPRTSLTEDIAERTSLFTQERKVSIIAAGALVFTIAMIGVAMYPMLKKKTATHDVVVAGEQSGEATITASNAFMVPNESAVQRIIGAKCAHEAKCDANGDQAYMGEAECNRQSRVTFGAALDEAASCARGVDSAKLDQCVSAFENETCGDTAQAHERAMACRTSVLCPPTQ